MLFTRSFGALRARSLFFAATERDEETGRHGDPRFQNNEDANRTDRDRESVA